MNNLCSLNNLNNLGVSSGVGIMPTFSERYITSLGTRDVFTRASTGTLIDFEGLIKTAKINEARFEGARRVENLFAKTITTATDTISNWFTNRHTSVVVSGEDVTFSGSNQWISHSYDEGDLQGRTFNVTVVCESLISQDIKLQIKYINNAEAFFKIITLQAGVTRFNVQANFTVSDTVELSVLLHTYGLSNTVRTFKVREFQLEEVTGQANQNPSEYVSGNVGTGVELITNGGFDTDSDWTKTGLSTIQSGVATVESDATRGAVQQTFNTVKGKLYTAVFDCNVANTNYSLDIWNGSSPNINIGGDIAATGFSNKTGRRFLIFRAESTQTSIVLRNSLATGVSNEFDNASIKIADHGVNAGGVKYFPYENGNTVNGSDVVIEAQGANIPTATQQGILIEGQVTNLVTYSEDYNQATTDWNNFWDGYTVDSENNISPSGSLNATQITTIANATQPTGLFNSGTVLPDGVTHTSSIWLKGVVGGEQLRLSNGTTGTSLFEPITLTTEWVEYSYTADTSVGQGIRTLQIVTQNINEALSFYIWGAQTQTGAFPTSYIKTEASTVTKIADSLTADKFPTKDFAVVMTIKPVADFADMVNAHIRLFGTDDSGGASDEIRVFGANTSYFNAITGGGGAFHILKSDFTKDTTTKIAMSLSQEGSNVRAIIYKDGVEKLNTTTAGTLDHSDTGNWTIGSWNSNYSYANYKNVKLYKKKLTTAKMASLTTL